MFKSRKAASAASSAAPIAAAPIDLRTSSMIALDDTAAWLRERVPDRFPVDVDLRVMSSPSMLAAIASEFARRTRAELGTDDSFEEIEPALDALPSKLLVANPSVRELADLRARIDRVVERIRNPAAPEPLPIDYLEAALEIGVSLPAPSRHENTKAIAEEMIQAAYRARDTAVLRPIMLTFRKEALADAPRSLDARRARYALAGAGVLPPVSSSGPFGTSEAELRALSPVRDIVATRHAGTLEAGFVISVLVPRSYEALAAACGAPAPTHNRATITAHEELAELAAKHQARDFARGRDDNDRLYHVALRELHDRKSKEAADAAAAIVAELTVHRARLLEAFDRTLAELPIGPGWYYTRVVRESLAAWTDVPTWADARPSGALELMASFGVHVRVS